MSKKIKRQVSRSETQSPSSPAVNVTRIAPVIRSPRLSTTTEFNPDYSHVMTDLKRIGILALTFVAILVGLTFFLR